jgi:hypothetical protein
MEITQAFSYLMSQETKITATSTLRELFLELNSYNAQCLVFASFKQSESDFHESTKDVVFNLIDSTWKKVY